MKELSVSQEELLLEQLLYPESPFYNVGGCLVVQAALKEDVLEKVMYKIADLNPMMGAKLVQDVNGFEWQFCEFDTQYFLNPAELEGLSLEEAEAFCEKDFTRPFNILQGQPLYKITGKSYHDRFLIYFKFHHIILDGYGFQVLTNFIKELYNQLISNPENDPSIRLGDYRDYISHSKAYLNSEQYLFDKSFWKAGLEDVILQNPEVGTISTQAVASTKSSQAKIFYTQDFFQSISDQCASVEVNPFHYAVAVLGISICRAFQKNEFLLQLPIANRSGFVEKRTLGHFASVVHLLFQPNGQQTLKDLIVLIKKDLLKTYKHQHFPVSHLKKEFGGAVSMEQPLSELVFSYEMQNFQQVFDGNLAVGAVYDPGHSRVPFNVTIRNHFADKDVVVEFTYNEEQFSPGQVDYFIRIFDYLFRRCASLVDQHVSKWMSGIDFLSEDERAALIELGSSHQRKTYAQKETFVSRFGKQVSETPDATAICFEHETLSYLELDDWSDAFAQYLIQHKNCKPGQLISLCLPRNQWMPIAIIGVLKAGSGYLPISTDIPAERVQFLLTDSESAVLVDTAFMQAFILAKDNLTHVFSDLEPSAQDIAYCLYTSGSTGLPKGVLVSHQSLISRLDAIHDTIVFGHDERILQLTNYAFDVSIGELLLPLIAGSTVVLVSPGLEKDTDALLSMIIKNGITSLHAVPSLIQLVFGELKKRADLSELKLRRVISAGEALPVSLSKDWTQEFRIPLYNLYGPTEATIYASWYATNGNETRMPIGKPLPGTELLVLDNQSRLLPKGLHGELYIGGEGLAEGYLNRSDLNEEKFINHPYQQGATLYRTGDSVCWNEKGELEFYGRLDHQVKLNGYRIELGEIEQVLLSLKDSRNAVILFDESSKQLKAFYDGGLSEVEAMVLLEERLPSYMIPSLLVKMDHLPVNASGKVDRKQLESIGSSYKKVVKTEGPIGQFEKDLVRHWSALLFVPIDQISRTDNFYKLGGDSIKAIQLVSRLRQEGWNLSITDVLRNGDLKSQAALFRPLVRIPNQESYHGSMVFSSIQDLFLRKGFYLGNALELGYFHQSVLLELNDLLAVEHVQACVDLLFNHHDILRLNIDAETEWMGEIASSNGWVLPVEEYDLTQLAPDKQKDALQSIAIGLKSSVNLGHGQLSRIALFHTSSGNRLLVVFHHLLTDLVSWRIFLEDFSMLFQQQLEKNPMTLPARTDSFSWFTSKLRKFAAESLSAWELQYWSDVKRKAQGISWPIKSDNVSIKGTRRQLSHRFNLKETEALMLQLKQGELNGIEQLLLLSLSLAISRQFQMDKVAVMLETHGREEDLVDAQLGRTMGWFTGLFPVVLETGNGSMNLEFVRNNLYLLNNVPSKGLLHGYLPVDDQTPMVPLLFNHQGSFNASYHRGSISSFN